MANLPDKPTIYTIPWINGQTKLNSANLTSGVNNNLTNLKTAVDGIIDSFGDYLPLSGGTITGHTTFNSSVRFNDQMTGYGYFTLQSGLTVSGSEIHAGNEFHSGDATFMKNVTISAAAPTDASHATRKDYVDSMSAKMTEITWAALKALRDGGNLVPGMQYRITDYQCATTTSNTSSAGHVFDIIVTADTNSKLNENACACLHVGDTYFANNKLEAWKLKYCLDNDINRFAWADATNGKGVIYRMIDEFENDVPYDFKNILFTKSGAYTNAYTFSYTENGEIKDASLFSQKDCYNNVIKKYLTSTTQALNFIVFYSNSTNFGCYANIFGHSCSSNTFGYGCSYNTFGNSCSSNTFGTGCFGNTFGNSSHHNTFGTSCYSNIFSFSCASNTFGNYCFYNTLGDVCYGNSFGNSCNHNILGNLCSSNTFTSGNNSSNILGINCSSNVFGAYCSRNMFGSNCSNIKFGTSSSVINYCKNIIIDNECSYLYINSSDTDASSSNYLQNVHINLGVSGSSSANRLTLTVPDRALAYETEFAKNGSTKIVVE